MLFHGPSGSGKTQLANYLTQQLDREMIYRTGSDLLNNYVGGTEQRIANLFRSCDVKREIIFLDEAEGLLGSRDGAQRSWEVTQVNEFLRQIEQFKGIFIAATNHVGHLDVALMRRFAFRLEFKPLTLEQRVDMLSEMCGASIYDNLSAISSIQRLGLLTSGDFANVKKRLTTMSKSLSLRNFMRELEIEVQAKEGAENRVIGFLG